jgi:hypothetical protein
MVAVSAQLLSATGSTVTCNVSACWAERAGVNKPHIMDTDGVSRGGFGSGPPHLNFYILNGLIVNTIIIVYSCILISHYF